MRRGTCAAQGGAKGVTLKFSLRLVARRDLPSKKLDLEKRATGKVRSVAAKIQSRRERPTRRQVDLTRAAVDWYLARYYATKEDPGVASMFLDRDRVGAFAVDRDALERGDDGALFRLLIATTMFQRRQDVQILRILRGMRPADVAEVTDARTLLRLVEQGGCARMRTNAELIADCDLAKDPRTRLGCCAFAPTRPCHLKRHTVALKRYGHFGKVPTSAALALREAGVDGLSALYRLVLSSVRSPQERARILEERLSVIWRVSSKIACMFLSALTNPDLCEWAPPWTRGIDWTHFVVIDSNVDAFLASIGYRGRGTYEARRVFLQAVAREIDLSALDRRLHRYNPRLVQQALYLFMSATNRRSLSQDCSREGVRACRACPRSLRTRCALRQRAGSPGDSKLPAGAPAVPFSRLTRSVVHQR